MVPSGPKPSSFDALAMNRHQKFTVSMSKNTGAYLAALSFLSQESYSRKEVHPASGYPEKS